MMVMLAMMATIIEVNGDGILRLMVACGGYFAMDEEDSNGN
jgi:hypothetical protein